MSQHVIVAKQTFDFKYNPYIVRTVITLLYSRLLLKLTVFHKDVSVIQGFLTLRKIVFLHV